MDGIYLIAYKMHSASISGSESYRWEARHRGDERKQKISQSRTRSVRVRWFAKTAIEGQRAGFPLLCARACVWRAALSDQHEAGHLNETFTINPLPSAAPDPP